MVVHEFHYQFIIIYSFLYQFILILTNSIGLNLHAAVNRSIR